MRNPRRTLIATLAALVLGTGLTLAVASPAQAHDELVSSYPEADTTVPESPAEITLSFSGELIAGMQSAAVEVIAPDGQNIATDPPSADATSITQHLAADPPAGMFTVRWKVVSSDGHPISGEYTYTVELNEAGASSPAVTPSTAPQTPAPSPTATETSTDNGSGRDLRGRRRIPDPRCRRRSDHPRVRPRHRVDARPGTSTPRPCRGRAISPGCHRGEGLDR